MTPTPDLDAQVRDIKRLLRAAMDGVLSHAMRQSGVNYRVNFGVETFRLVEMAADLPHSVRLSTALYADDIRELRLLAFLVVPPEEVDEELALHYVEGLRYVEEAQMLVLHLLAERPFASQLAFRLLRPPQPLGALGGVVAARPPLHGRTDAHAARRRRDSRSRRHRVGRHGRRNRRAQSRPQRAL